MCLSGCSIPNEIYRCFLELYGSESERMSFKGRCLVYEKNITRFVFVLFKLGVKR